MFSLCILILQKKLYRVKFEEFVDIIDERETR